MSEWLVALKEGFKIAPGLTGMCWTEFMAVITVQLLIGSPCFCLSVCLSPVLVSGCSFLALLCSLPACAVPGNALITAAGMFLPWQMARESLLFLCCFTGHSGLPEWIQVKGNMTCGWVYERKGDSETSVAVIVPRQSRFFLKDPRQGFCLWHTSERIVAKKSVQAGEGMSQSISGCAWGLTGAPQSLWPWISPWWSRCISGWTSACAGTGFCPKGLWLWINLYHGEIIADW